MAGKWREKDVSPGPLLTTLALLGERKSAKRTSIKGQPASEQKH